MGSFVHDMMAGAGVPTMMDANGVPVSYVPPAGPAVPMTAIVGSEWTEETRASDGQLTKAVFVTVSAAPIAGGYRLNGAFEISGVVWGIKTITAADTYLVTVTCVRYLRGEAIRGGVK